MSRVQESSVLIRALFAFGGSISQTLIERIRKRIQGAVAHFRIRSVARICIAVVAVICTAAPILLAQDSSGSFSPATRAEISRVEAEIDRIEADTLHRLDVADTYLGIAYPDSRLLIGVGNQRQERTRRGALP
jgi:hypothetical protein